MWLCFRVIRRRQHSAWCILIQLVRSFAGNLTWSNSRLVPWLLLCFDTFGSVFGVDLGYYFWYSITLVLKTFVHLFGEVFLLVYLWLFGIHLRVILWDHSCLVCNRLETYFVDSGTGFRARGRTSHWGNHVKILVLLLI